MGEDRALADRRVGRAGRGEPLERAADAAQFGHPGARGELTLRLRPGPGKRTLVRLGYTRLLAPGSGYHALRASLARRLFASFIGTLEGYQYLYDEPIRGRISSAFYAASLGFQPLHAVDVLWAASLASSPFRSSCALVRTRF